MTAIRLVGRTELDGQPLRCPTAGPGETPRQLTLIEAGSLVAASCGRKHRGPDGRRAGCWWTLDGVPPAVLHGLAQAGAGTVRATLPGGRTLQGRIASVDTSTPAAGRRGKAGPATAAAAHGQKARAAGGTAGPHAARNSAGGGTARAAFQALAAVAGAIGQTAGAIGQTATAASSVVSSTTGLIGRGVDLGRETVRAVDHTAQRDFARRNTTGATES